MYDGHGRGSGISRWHARVDLVHLEAGHRDHGALLERPLMHGPVVKLHISASEQFADNEPGPGCQVTAVAVGDYRVGEVNAEGAGDLPVLIRREKACRGLLPCDQVRRKRPAFGDVAKRMDIFPLGGSGILAQRPGVDQHNAFPAGCDDLRAGCCQCGAFLYAGGVDLRINPRKSERIEVRVSSEVQP